MKRILVTGGNGQLGQSIHQWAHLHPTSPFEFIFTDSDVLDISNQEEVETFFFSNTFDYCINCAAYTQVDKAETDVEKAFAVNADGAAFLAKECNDKGIGFIHISTDYVFDGNASEPYTEDHPTNPINIYGKSKLLGEQHVMGDNPEAIIIRTSWVYSPDFGHNFYKTMQKLFSEKEVLSIVNDQWGRPTHAYKLATAIMQLIQLPKLPKGLFHYASDEPTTWFGFAQRIASELESNITLRPIPTADYPTPAKRPQYSILDTSKIESILQ